MADIGRWGVIDPLAETTTRINPYNYALDNPVMYVDPDGRKAQYLDSEYELFGVENSGIIAAFQRQGNGFGDFSSFLGDGPYFYKGAGSSGGGGSSTFGQTPAYRALMSGQTSSITNVNGYLNWNTLDNANANGMLDDGSMGGMTAHSVKVRNSNDTPWDAYKNWADYGSGTIGTMYQTIADQRTTLYNSGYWVDNLGRRRLVNTFASPLRGSSANYLRTTTMFGKYAKRAGYIGYGLSAVEIGQGLYEDKGRFGKNTAVATAKVTTGIVVSGAVGAGATWLTGALAGAAGGSVAPGVGTVIGFVVGGVLGDW